MKASLKAMLEEHMIDFLDEIDGCRTAPRPAQVWMMAPPPIIAFECEYLIEPNVRDEPRAKRVGSGPWLGASGSSTTQDAEPTQQANDHP